MRQDAETEGQLAGATRTTGLPIPQIIREAVAEQCRLLLGQRLDRRLADVIGTVSSDGGRAERTGEAFADLVRHRRQATSV